MWHKDGDYLNQDDKTAINKAEHKVSRYKQADKKK